MATHQPPQHYRVTRPLGSWKAGDLVDLVDIPGGAERAAALVARGALVPAEVEPPPAETPRPRQGKGKPR